MRFIALSISLAAIAVPAWAHAFERLTTRDAFVAQVQNRDLKRFGISLKVTQDGGIEGSAFGQSVTGDWQWKDGYFCRDLYFGGKDLGPNCQVVETRSNRIRFIADQGKGDYADFTLK